MANQQHLSILKRGVREWNFWRAQNPNVIPDLRGANLTLTGGFTSDNVNNRIFFSSIAPPPSATPAGSIDLSEINLSNADLGGAILSQAFLRRANLSEASLIDANLFEAYLEQALLERADLRRANLALANLNSAVLYDANLMGSLLVHTNLRGANLSGCHVFGVSVWGVKVNERTVQSNLIISNVDEPTITVDNLEVAQFIYLLLNNERIRGVLDTITSKVVLILGRFTSERKAVLDALRQELRQHNYTPVIFDFDKPASKNITETVSTLAHLARFAIADITDAKSIPQELQRIVPDLPSLPVQPIILASQYEYAMFKDFLDYPWVLLPHRYASTDDLVSSLAEKVVGPALAKSMEIEEKRRIIESELSRR